MKQKLDRAVDFFLAMLVIGMTIVVGVSVFYRYVLNQPLSWSEEITRLMVVWLSFVGAYMAMRENKHIGFDLFVKYFSPGPRKAVALGGQALIAIFLVVVVWEGFIFSWEFLDVPMPYTDISVGWFYYTVLPVSGVLMLAQTILNILDIFHTREKA